MTDLDTLSTHTPTDPGYDAARRGFQTYRPHRPDLVLDATGTEDVVRAVRYAAERDLPITVIASGHGTRTPATDGLLINTRAMDAVAVDPARRTARIEAGAVWRSVVEAAAPHGLAPLAGSAPLVGAISYTIGGGLPLLGRTFGWTADHVRSLEVVTLDGRTRQVSAEEDPDLFWALRGGSGNFGVVTAIEVELMPVPNLWGGTLAFDATSTAELLAAWLRWSDSAPDELNTSLVIASLPDLPIFPEPVRGRHVAMVHLAYVGANDAGEALVAPLREAGTVLLDDLGPVPLAEVGRICNDPVDPAASLGNTALFGELDDQGVAALAAIISAEAPGAVIVELRRLGGALSRPALIGGPIGARSASYAMNVISPLRTGTEAEADAARAAQADRLATVAPWVTGGAVLNFLSGEAATTEAVARTFAPDDYDRLRRIKASYDPQNLLRYNANVPPAQD